MLIRSARPEDAAAVAAIYDPYVSESTVSFEYDAPSAAEIARRMGELMPHYPWIAAEEDGVLLGYAYAGPHSSRQAYCWGAHLSVYVSDRALGRGVGHELYGTCSGRGIMCFTESSPAKMTAAADFMRPWALSGGRNSLQPVSNMANGCPPSGTKSDCGRRFRPNLLYPGTIWICGIS